MSTPGLVSASWSLPIRPERLRRSWAGGSRSRRRGAAARRARPARCPAGRPGPGPRRGRRRSAATPNAASRCATSWPILPRPDDADGLAVELDAGERAALPLPGPQARVGGRDVPGRGQQQRDRVLGGARRCWRSGALTTITPRAVAAGTSTLSSPTPARATTLSRVDAASTSASTLVAERTSSASASATAASSAGRSVPSTWRISTSSPSRATADGASFSASRTTGRVGRRCSRRWSVLPDRLTAVPHRS